MSQEILNGAKIYRLLATGTTDIYIGSTCGTLERRLWHHNHCAANPNQKQTAAHKLYEEGRTVAIELVENVICQTIDELKARERWWIENTPNCINKNIPGQTWQERHKKREKEIKEYMNVFRAIPHECECGAVISKAEKARHERSQKHITKMAAKISPE